MFDTVSLSNFLLSETSFVLEKRYRKCAFITRQVYDEVSAGIAEFPKLKHIDKLIADKTFKLVGHLSLTRADEILPKMIDAGFYSPTRSLADIG